MLNFCSTSKRSDEKEAVEAFASQAHMLHSYALRAKVPQKMPMVHKWLSPCSCGHRHAMIFKILSGIPT